MYVSTNGEYLRRDSISACSCAMILSRTSIWVGVSDSFAHAAGDMAINAKTNNRIPRAYTSRPNLGAGRKPRSVSVDNPFLSRPDTCPFMSDCELTRRTLEKPFVYAKVVADVR